MLKKYDLIVVKEPEGFIGMIIKLLLKSKYSHVAMYIGGFHVVDTDFFQNSQVHELKYKYGTYDIYRLKERISQCEACKINEFILKNLNQKYDFVEALGTMINKKLGMKNRYICISFVLESFKFAGIDVGRNDLSFESITRSKYFEKINE